MRMVGSSTQGTQNEKVFTRAWMDRARVTYSRRTVSMAIRIQPSSRGRIHRVLRHRNRILDPAHMGGEVVSVTDVTGNEPYRPYIEPDHLGYPLSNRLIEVDTARRGKPVQIRYVGNYIHGLKLEITNQKGRRVDIRNLVVMYDCIKITEDKKMPIYYQVQEHPEPGCYLIWFSSKIPTVMATWFALCFTSQYRVTIKTEIL